MRKNTKRTARKHQLHIYKDFSLDMDLHHMEPCYRNRATQHHQHGSTAVQGEDRTKKNQSTRLPANQSIQVVDEEHYKGSHVVEAISQTLETDKMHQPHSNHKAYGEAFHCRLPHQLHKTTSIDGQSSASIDTQPLPSDSHNAKLVHDYLTPDEFRNFKETEGEEGARKKPMQATPSDPVTYSREELDEKLNEIYTIHYDSMNDFKCKLIVSTIRSMTRLPG
ncbi:hypothetical protein Rs2_02787 [Raphanus sativus]|nr:hypothetical protein Rs2_02787 [Raphanus sativus]